MLHALFLAMLTFTHNDHHAASVLQLFVYHKILQVACPTAEDLALTHGSAPVPDCIELFMYGMAVAHTTGDHISSLNGHGYTHALGTSGTLTNTAFRTRTLDNVNAGVSKNVSKPTRNRCEFGVQMLTPVFTQLAYMYQGPSVDTI